MSFEKRIFYLLYLWLSQRIGGCCNGNWGQTLRSRCHCFLNWEIAVNELNNCKTKYFKCEQSQSNSQNFFWSKRNVTKLHGRPAIDFYQPKRLDGSSSSPGKWIPSLCSSINNKKFYQVSKGLESNLTNYKRLVHLILQLRHSKWRHLLLVTMTIAWSYRQFIYQHSFCN